MHWETFTQDNYSTVGGDGGCRVGKVQDPPIPFPNLLPIWSDQELLQGLCYKWEGDNVSNVSKIIILVHYSNKHRSSAISHKQVGGYIGYHNQSLWSGSEMKYNLLIVHNHLNRIYSITYTAWNKTEEKKYQSK